MEEQILHRLSVAYSGDDRFRQHSTIPENRRAGQENPRFSDSGNTQGRLQLRFWFQIPCHAESSVVDGARYR